MTVGDVELDVAGRRDRDDRLRAAVQVDPDVVVAGVVDRGAAVVAGVLIGIELDRQRTGLGVWLTQEPHRAADRLRGAGLGLQDEQETIAELPRVLVDVEREGGAEGPVGRQRDRLRSEGRTGELRLGIGQPEEFRGAGDVRLEGRRRGALVITAEDEVRTVGRSERRREKQRARHWFRWTSPGGSFACGYRSARAGWLCTGMPSVSAPSAG